MNENRRSQGSGTYGGRAVVIGGSLAGMLAARVLSEHYAQVLVIDSDEFPEQIANRPGVPHGRHLHALMRRGLVAMEELFPALENDLVAAGAQRTESGVDFHIHFSSGWNPMSETGLNGVRASRPLIESVVRRRLGKTRNVQVIPRSRVLGLLKGIDGVAGVRLRNDEMESESIRAGLVVDATGRASRLPEWLADLGFPSPKEEVVDAFWGYASREYRIPDSHDGNWGGLLCMARPPDLPRVGVIQSIEENRWLVTLAGVMRNYPPADDQGYLEFAKGLSSPIIYQAMCNAEPLTPIMPYRHTAGRRRHYESVRPWPAGLLVLGDSLCCFNPVYGQGMTVCALEALALRSLLVTHGSGVRDRCVEAIRRFSRIVDTPWMMATNEDRRWPGIDTAPQDSLTRLLETYTNRLKSRIPTDPVLFQAFGEVLHMMRPPQSLFRPSILARVFGLIPPQGRSQLRHVEATT